MWEQEQVLDPDVANYGLISFQTPVVGDRLIKVMPGHMRVHGVCRRERFPSSKFLTF